MITCDNERTAKAIAARLGIDEVVVEVRPEGKVKAIQRFRTTHRYVAYVGDGINDAPALAEANVGLAIGTGTGVAMEAADVVLMFGSLQGVLNAIALSKATIGNIRQHGFRVFGYNGPDSSGSGHAVSGLWSVAVARFSRWRDGICPAFS